MRHTCATRHAIAKTAPAVLQGAGVNLEMVWVYAHGYFSLVISGKQSDNVVEDIAIADPAA